MNSWFIFDKIYIFLWAPVSLWLSQVEVILLFALVRPHMPSHSSWPPSFMPFHLSCPPNPHALPLILPSHSSCSPNPHALPLPMPSHSSYPPTSLALPLLLPSLSSCPPTPSALPLLLPSHSSCPPTPPALLLLLLFCALPIWEGMGGQKEEEGRRSGRAVGAGGQEGRTGTNTWKANCFVN